MAGAFYRARSEFLISEGGQDAMAVIVYEFIDYEYSSNCAIYFFLDLWSCPAY